MHKYCLKAGRMVDVCNGQLNKGDNNNGIVNMLLSFNLGSNHGPVRMQLRSSPTTTVKYIHEYTPCYYIIM